MQNLKIKVNNEAESKEVQELLFELGYKWYGKGKIVSYLNDVTNGEFGYLVAWSTGCFTNVIQMGCGSEDAKEITLAELRDMVVLKRNDVNDATHESSIYKYFKACDGWYYFDLGCTDKWQKSAGAKPEYYEKLKPIEKTMKKEYLFKQISGDYNLVDHDCQGRAIETPEWAEFAALNGDNEINFYTGIGLEKNHFISDAIVWQRPAQPEALPFIDDNPKSLNEQYAEIEQVRQAVKVKSGSDSDHMADAMSYGFVGGIDATIAERQSTYGNFEDVAFVTENIMSVLGSVRVNGLSELPATHRMALYMIASKMARIVNGDFNHLDSWHDIGGYSKLIEGLIKVNNNG